MMRLTIAREPDAFEKDVREPGENVLALLAGEPLPHPRQGRPIEAMKAVGGVMVQKTVDDFPYWQDCLEDLHAAYDGICAYYCYHVEHASLPHVEHFVAKCKDGAALAYEWTNYRLACGYANSRKHKYPDVLDPASIQDGWFQLDLDTLEVRADPTLPDLLRDRVELTIVRLDLRRGRALKVRQRAMQQFRSGAVHMKFLEQNHPFLAGELGRQGICAREQLAPLPAAIIEAVEPELSVL